MLWRRKNNGFDWHKHVRTTIKLRREARRQKLDDAVELAVGGIKGAGRVGVSAGSSGMDAANRLLIAPIAWIGGAISGALGFLSRGLGRGLEPVGRLTERPGLAPWLALSAVIAALLGLGRARVDGWDAVALVLGLGGFAGLVALIVPPLLSGRGPAALAAVSAGIASAWQRIPGLRGLPVETLRGLTAVLALVLMGGAAYLAQRVAPSIPLPGIVSLPGFSRPVLEGPASAQAGDTLRIRDQLVRLAGIEAPALDQSCGGQGREPRWRCGEAARTQLREVLRGKTVRCELGPAGASGLPTATCKSGDVDIAEQLVARGAVFAEQGFFASYSRQEDAARNTKRGVWRGQAERPDEYRARLWETAKKAAPQGCPIKGQISRNERIYVVPWAAGYARARVRTDRGERWFCTEQEAQAAGWRPQGQT